MTALAVWIGASVEAGAADKTSTVIAAPSPTTSVQRAPAKNWPMFRGNLHQTGLAGVALNEPLALKWKYKAGDAILSTAAIVDGVVYFGTVDGHLVAVDLASGKERWKYSTNKAPISSSPAVASGTVFVGDEDGFFHAVRARDGEKQWGPFETEGEIISSPSVVGDHVLFGSYDGHLYCLRAKDGSVVWKHLTEGRVHASPAVAGYHTFVAGCDGFLRVIDIRNGEETRAVELGTYCVATPAIVQGIGYLGTYGEQVLGVDWQAGEIVWHYEHESKHFPFYASAAVTDELVIVGGRDRFVHGLDRKTGKRRWIFASKGRIESSPVVAGKRVYVGSLDGNVYGLDLATGERVWQYTTGDGITASPAVVDGHLVIGSEDGFLYCFTGRSDPRPDKGPANVRALRSKSHGQ